MDLQTCVVCGQQAPCEKLKSTCSDKQLDYCQACVANRYESYDELSGYGFTYDMFSESYRQLVVNPTLRYYNKSVDTFNKDVEEKRCGDDS